jgi:hypothetical protein
MAGALLIRLAFPTVARRTARAEPDPDGEGAPVNTAIAT